MLYFSLLLAHTMFMEYQIVQDEVLGNWIIVIDDYDDQITEDQNLDPFETEEEAKKYMLENL